jgi:hypothetical protein
VFRVTSDVHVNPRGLNRNFSNFCCPLISGLCRVCSIYSAFTNEWCSYKSEQEIYFSPYTSKTYVRSTNCPHFVCATSSSHVILTTGPRVQFLRSLFLLRRHLGNWLGPVVSMRSEMLEVHEELRHLRCWRCTFCPCKVKNIYFLYLKPHHSFFNTLYNFILHYKDHLQTRSISCRISLTFRMIPFAFWILSVKFLCKCTSVSTAATILHRNESC